MDVRWTDSTQEPAKAGMISLTGTAAVEYGRKNIRANCICPGCVETPLFEMLVQITPNSRAEIGRDLGAT
ncbi:MAG: SDR family oxidoreductase [Candidatus Binatia bacterium]